MLVLTQEMALDLFAPFYDVEALGFFPGGVKSHPVKKLFDSFNFEDFLIFLHLFEVLNWPNVR